MKYPLLNLLFLFVMGGVSAQVNFENAYYINKSGETIHGLLKNEDWNNSPTYIEFKNNIEGESKQLTVKDISEFGIQDKFKYITAHVDIDRASENTNWLTSTRNPDFKRENLFLKVLIEGDATLYVYKDNNLLRLFYKTDNVALEQLVYKRYKASNTSVAKNEQYKQQLLNNLKCESINLSSINNLEYVESDMARLFRNYNKCKNTLYDDYESTKTKGEFNLSLRPSIRSASFSFENSESRRRSADFDNELSFGMGVELEYVMPFNRNKWAIIFEPTYQNYKPSPTTTPLGQEVKLEYSSIEMPFGLRHYLFLNEKSKIFVNASFVLDLSMDSTLDFETDDDLEITTGSSAALGLGFKYNDKYSIEVRYQTDRSLLQDYVFFTSQYSSMSLLVGYTLF